MTQPRHSLLRKEAKWGGLAICAVALIGRELAKRRQTAEQLLRKLRKAEVFLIK